MEIDIVTREDLRQFKREMLDEFKQIIESKAKDSFDREWLKSAEVRKLLGISPGTLQNLRINGTLPYRKVGGSMYYRRENIRKMMEGSNSNAYRNWWPTAMWSTVPRGIRPRAAGSGSSSAREEG